MKSVYEDFAEVFVTYIAVKNTDQEASLRSVMPGRFALIDRLLRRR